MISSARLLPASSATRTLLLRASTPPSRRHLAHGKHTVCASAPMELNPSEVAPLVDSGEYTYLDVRTAEEFAGGHCPHSVNIPIMFSAPGGMAANESFLEEVAAKFPNPSTDHIAVGCKAGPRATKALSVLTANKYEHLLNVLGGFSAWEAAGLPIEK